MLTRSGVEVVTGARNGVFGRRGPVWRVLRASLFAAAPTSQHCCCPWRFAGRFWPLPATAVTPLVISVLALALTMELWQLVQRLPRLARVVLLPGLGLQRLTTREPELAETRVALTALAAVLRRELAHG